jgi:hypothetical protein
MKRNFHWLYLKMPRGFSKVEKIGVRSVVADNKYGDSKLRSAVW